MSFAASSMAPQFHCYSIPQGRFRCQDWGSVKLIAYGNVMADLGLIPRALGWLLNVGDRTDSGRAADV